MRQHHLLFSFSTSVRGKCFVLFLSFFSVWRYDFGHTKNSGHRNWQTSPTLICSSIANIRPVPKSILTSWWCCGWNLSAPDWPTSFSRTASSQMFPTGSFNQDVFYVAFWNTPGGSSGWNDSSSQTNRREKDTKVWLGYKVVILLCPLTVVKLQWSSCFNAYWECRTVK